MKAGKKRITHWHVTVVLAALLLLTPKERAMAEGFLQRDGARLTLDGKEYRAIGANVPGLFSDYSGIGFHIGQTFGTAEAARQNSLTAILEAERHKIAFFRFWASGFWPKEMKLYFDKPAAYWKAMDDLFALCRQHHVRLVPSLFFNSGLWPLICEEDYSALADPGSKTYRAMRQYAKELVTRYKDDTNVLAWELTNEMFLAAEVNMEGRDAPGAGVMLGQWHKAKHVLQDSLTTATILRFYRDMTKFIKSLDPNHLITSGDAGPRTTSVSLRESFPRQVWTPDTLRQNLASLLMSQPEPLDVLSLHHYGSLNRHEEPENMGVATCLEGLRVRIRCAHAANTPIFVGELGNTKPTLQEDREGAYLRAAVDLLEREGASLAAIWAWYFPWQKENNMTAQSHPAVLKRVAEFNRKHSVR